MRKKTRMLHLRLTEEEHNALEKFCEKIGEKRSHVLRKLIREWINKDIDLLHAEQSLLMVAIRQLTGISNNLNQISTAINSGKVHRTIDQNYLDLIKTHVKKVKTLFEACIHKTRKRLVNHDI